MAIMDFDSAQIGKRVNFLFLVSTNKKNVFRNKPSNTLVQLPSSKRIVCSLVGGEAIFPQTH